MATKKKPQKPTLFEIGYRSRKLWFAVCTSAGIFVAALLASKLPELSPLYETMVGGLLGVQALYSGANVGAKVAARKGGVAAPHSEYSPQPAESSPPIEGGHG